ncbi:hypothetical protein K4K52_001114 [Colletotrichum sp. SAR 10_76]|nr:hypothetical protein K4K52_001114 [Colletotrichum sp. SAR 10_76]
MEQFQLLDEHVSNLILRFGFLDVEDLPFATAEEVENAAALALQMAAPEELIEIAPEDPNPGAYIDWQERNRILADSPVEPDDGAEEGGEDCIICSGGLLPFVPVVEDDFEGHPANFDPDFGGALPLIDVGDGPEPDHIDPEPIMANANGQARGQQRYYIMMFYADGNSTEVGDPNWRRDSPENMRRIREGDETEGRVWPHHEKSRRVSTAGSGTADSSGTAGAVA